MSEPRARNLLVAPKDHSRTSSACGANTGECGRSTRVITLKNVRRLGGLTYTRAPHSRDELIIRKWFESHCK